MKSKAELYVIKTLMETNISVKHLGYHYLERCLQIALENKEYLFSLRKSLYSIVAKEFSTTVDKVEKNMRYSIKRGNIKKMEELGITANGKIPSVGTFIKTVAKIIEIKL